MKEILNQITPPIIRNAIKFYLNIGKIYYCPVCKRKVTNFIPYNNLKNLDKYGYIHNIFYLETFNFLHYFCPKCRSSDRYRLFSLFINIKLEKESEKIIHLLDFAPHKAFQRFLIKRRFIEYRSADLYESNVEDKVDIQYMHIYKDSSFDVFICSHILEHVDNDDKAISELYRILNKEGWGIVMVPIDTQLNETYEDRSIITPEDKWKHFGQDTHLRVYSKNGFKNKLNKAGFKISEYGIDYFGNDVFEKHGIHERSVLYIVEK